MSKFNPFRARGGVVSFLGGGFSVRGCPDPEELAEFIAASCNKAHIDEIEGRDFSSVCVATSPCKTCGGKGIVDDGEFNMYPDGSPYLNGPVKCVKDCPDCKPKASFADHIRWVTGADRRGHGAGEVAIANMRAWHDQEVKDALAAQMAVIKQAIGHDQDEFNRKWKDQRDRAEAAETIARHRHHLIGKLESNLADAIARAEAAEAALALVKPAGHCTEGDKCVCGGDLPSIREGCGNWRA